MLRSNKKKNTKRPVLFINYGWKFVALCSVIFLSITFYAVDQYWTWPQLTKPYKLSSFGLFDKLSPPSKIHVAISTCGSRLEDAVVLAQSLAMTTTTPVVLHAFLEKNLQPMFENATNAWPKHLFRNFETDVRDIFWPTRVLKGIPSEYWQRNFQSCAYQRLFLPEAFPDLDRVIYLDSDALFLAPVRELWDMQSRFNANQIMGLVPENNPGGISFYQEKRRQPFYGKLGLNSGMILYDLAKMNRTQYLVEIWNISTVWRGMIELQDQGILNIMFHFHPERVYEIPCPWHFREDYCRKTTCPEAENQGVNLIHGSRAVFHSNGVPSFKAIFNAFRDTPKANITVKDVLSRLEENLTRIPAIHNTTCGDNTDKYKVHLRRLVEGEGHK